MAGSMCYPKTCNYGEFCDEGTLNCESCDSICNPSRNTMYECRRRTECNDYPLSSTLTYLKNTTSPVQPDVLVLTTVIGSCVAVSLIVLLLVCIYRRYNRVCCVACAENLKTPVPVSEGQQHRDSLMGNPPLLRQRSLNGYHPQHSQVAPAAAAMDADYRSDETVTLV